MRPSRAARRSRAADTVLSALSEAVVLPAQGQGTMNNLVIGGSGWTYYETIGGGQGASSRGPGPSGVHVGMRNTLNTPTHAWAPPPRGPGPAGGDVGRSNPLNAPAGAFELEYPMRVTRYELIYGSGGAGE